MSTPEIDQVADLAQAKARLVAAEADLAQAKADLAQAKEKGDKELILMYGNQVTMYGNQVTEFCRALTELEKAETAKVAEASVKPDALGQHGRDARGGGTAEGCFPSFLMSIFLLAGCDARNPHGLWPVIVFVVLCCGGASLWRWQYGTWNDNFLWDGVKFLAAVAT